jgi:cyanophycinase
MPDKRERIIAALAERPDHVAFRVDEGAALVVRGRQVQVLGDGAVTVMLAACAGRPHQEIELKPGSDHDFVMLRRAAQERALARFPPQVPPAPQVESGSLVIAGGGALPGEVMQRFIELAGGPDAPIVVLPIAAGDTLPEDDTRDIRTLSRAGARNVTSLRARRREDVESPEFLKTLEAATGVWFNGGRQWRFVDAYMGTQAEQRLHEVLRRGGVIGGSSAGASIQGQYMPRGSPLGNTDMMADGYERGLGFLPGVAIDQHFTQRRRHVDMTRLMRRYPQLLGIGIDEATAIVVQGSFAEVVGRGNAHFYDYRTGPPGGQTDYMLAGPGQRYDLAQRRLLTNE